MLVFAEPLRVSEIVKVEKPYTRVRLNAEETILRKVYLEVATPFAAAMAQQKVFVCRGKSIKLMCVTYRA